MTDLPDMVSVYRDAAKPCRGRNTNVCVAEGCWAEDCLKPDLVAHRLIATLADNDRLRAENERLTAAVEYTAPLVAAAKHAMEAPLDRDWDWEAGAGQLNDAVWNGGDDD
jgi:hypothetical protein